MLAAQLYVDLIGAEAIMEEGRRAFDAGHYQWAAPIPHHLAFAQPDNQAARTCRPAPTTALREPETGHRASL